MFDRFFLALKFSAGSYLGDLSSNIPHPWSAVSEHNFDSGGRTVKLDILWTRWKSKSSALAGRCRDNFLSIKIAIEERDKAQTTTRVEVTKQIGVIHLQWDVV